MPLAAFPKCFLPALCDDRTMTVEQWIDGAAEELDVDGLEFLSNFTPVGDKAALAELKQRVEDHGLAIPMMCHSPDFTKPDSGARKEEIELEKRVIEATADLGGKFCRVLSGQRRPDVAIADGIGYAAECIHACLPTAADHGITLILENHYKDGWWEYPEFAQKLPDFLALLEAIGAPANFGVNYDPSNAIIAGDDPLEVLERVKHRVVTMHASDRYLSEGATLEDLRKLEADPVKGYAGILQHGVIGQGLNDYDKIFSTLSSVGFTGWVSIEDGQDPEVGMEHLRLSANFLRRRMALHHLA
jgi:sugar phosphate isomerase/epimerase